MDMTSAEEGIKKAWVAGVISGVFTLIVTAAAMAGYSFMGFSVWNLLDVAVIFGLTFGIYKKSRACAVIMLLYFVGSKIFIWKETGSVSGLPLALILSYYFYQGVTGTFEYHSEGNAQSQPVVKSGSAPVPKFKTKEEYAQWKADRLANPQGMGPVGSREYQSAEESGSGRGWIAAIVIVALLVGAFIFTDLGKTMLSKLPSPVAPAWGPFSSPEGNFSILMPGTPSHATNAVNTAVGTIDMHMYSRELGNNTAYAVIYSDYPEFITRASPDKVLDGGRDGAIANSKGKLISEQNIFLDGGHAGREIKIDIPGKGLMKIRAFLVRNRLYQVMVAAPGDVIDSEESRKFLTSFNLLTK